MRARSRRSRAGRHARPAAQTVGREILEWAVTLALAAGLALSVHIWVGELITIIGPSMEPNIIEDERVLISKLEYYSVYPKRGDVVVVRFPDRSENIIKRVIAVAGERIGIHDGSVYINGAKLVEPYTMQGTEGYMEDMTVPAGTVFVMGDNRGDSHDSRDVGPIPLQDVKGRAYAVMWPPEKYQSLTQYSGMIETAQAAGDEEGLAVG